jgi:DNA-binding PadR family transcriptional regulator
MQDIEERSGGLWRPSPGSVYPTLSQLEDEGLIRATEQDGTKLFELTDAGRQQVADRGDAPAPWEQPDGSSEEAIHDLRSLAKQLLLAVRQVVHAGDEGQIEKARQTLADARRALYRILADEGEESPE